MTLTGVHVVTVGVFEEYSQITKTFSFNLTVTCVRSITTASTINDVIYYVGDPKIDTGIPSYSITPSGCSPEVIYSVQLADGSALPLSIAFDGSTIISVFEEDSAAVAVYQVKIIAQDMPTLIQSDELIFQVTIRLKVTGLNIVTGTNVSDLTYRIGSPAVLLNAPEYTMEPPTA